MIDTRLPIICSRATAWKLVEHEQKKHRDRMRRVNRNVSYAGWWLSVATLVVLLFAL